MQQNFSKLIPFTVHIRNSQFLMEPERIFIRCDVNYKPEMLEYVWAPLAGAQVSPHCLEPVCEKTGLYMVVGSATKTVEALTLNVNTDAMANKYFTRELFREYVQQYCCSPNPCSDTEFLLLNGCVAEVNHCGLLI